MNKEALNKGFRDGIEKVAANIDLFKLLKTGLTYHISDETLRGALPRILDTGLRDKIMARMALTDDEIRLFKSLYSRF